MTRTRGAVNRAHVRIVQSEMFAAVVRAMADDNGGPAAIAGELEVSKALVSNWLAGTRAGLSRETWERVVWMACRSGDLPARLWSCVLPPADGRRWWPQGPPHDPRANWDRFKRESATSEAATAAAGPPAYLEDVLDEQVWERVKRGLRPTVARSRTRAAADPLAAWPVWRLVLVPPAVVEFVRSHWHGRFEYDDPLETEKGTRVPLMLCGELGD